MKGAEGSALEWAVALLHLPGERHALRQKPLPPGIERLLGIAAGAMPEALADAARAFGEPEARIREAARFYAREVLFFPQADAYRVLGVEAGADIVRIKTHHRLLQHWLHPDRMESQDDAVFAARVNGAWNQLRSADRRRAYDEALGNEVPRRQATQEADHDVELSPLPSVDFAEASPEGGLWRYRLPVAALCVLCIVLTILVIRDSERRPAAWDWQRDRVASPGPGTGDALVLDVPVRGEAQARPPARSARARAAWAMGMVGIEPDTGAQADQAAPTAAVPAERTDGVTVANAKPVAQVAETIRRTESGTASQVAVGAGARETIPADQWDAAETSPSTAQVQSAFRTGEDFMRYMQAPDRPPPPIWNSPAIQSSADLLRKGLHEQGTIRLAPPQWRIGAGSAVLTAAYHVQDAGKPDLPGRVTADLVWREGQWLLTGISMERL